MRVPDLPCFYLDPIWNIETKSAIQAVESRIDKIDVIRARLARISCFYSDRLRNAEAALPSAA
jgi:hypothetical protein